MAHTTIISDPSGLFGFDGMALVVDALAAPGIYPVTFGVTVDGRGHEVSQQITLSVDSFVFSSWYLAENADGALIAPWVALDFSAERYEIIEG